eukprot:142394_1
MLSRDVKLAASLLIDDTATFSCMEMCTYSVTLESMATKSFGVSVEFLDGQLSRFIVAGRLTAKIDKFGGVVETHRLDLKNVQYRSIIQQRVFCYSIASRSWPGWRMFKCNGSFSQL